MRIAVVCYPTYGGSGVVASELAVHLAERGHEVHAISYETPFRLAVGNPNLIVHTVDVSEYPLFRHPPYALNLTNKIIQVVKEHEIELIHSHYAIPHASSAWMAREILSREHCKKVLLACTLHGTDITLVGRDPAFYELTRFAIEQQDLLTTPSAWLADDTASAFSIDREGICVIPNFVDLERFKPNDQAEWRKCLAPNGEKIISHISNFRPVKRVDEMIRAFSVILKKGVPAILALVGDGPELPKAEDLARELGIREHIRVLGKMTNIEDVLQASDLFLLPSRAESFGLVALEAMACGVPVLGYLAGGLPEVVENNVSGILCPEGKDHCLGSIAADVLQDAARLQAMRIAARKRAEQFATEPIIDKFEQHLQELVDSQTEVEV
ncbi:MAG: N-acetyl-alpha-D-glucosaminyl L-malate synthase BshA [Planctomycetes bacterium]|nr:N-acetyl-alpha-D-glucosaminyl L-malate synthase BshA [Planctomycetota bacterium]